MPYNRDGIMKKHVFVLLVAATMLLSGCATGGYVFHSENSNMTQTQVVLKENNFRVVKTVKSLYLYKENVFWQTFRKRQLFESAYSKFLEEAGLTGSQVVINVNIEETNRDKSSSKTKGIMITGVVIEFTGGAHEDPK